MLVRLKTFINITSDVFHCHAPGKNLLKCRSIPCNDQLWCPLMQHSWHPTETSALVVYDLYAPKLDWLNGWMVNSNCVAIRGHLPIHQTLQTNNANVRYLWNIHACIRIFDNWMDRFECDGLHDENWLRSCEKFDSLSENRLIGFDQQAICN